MVSRKKRWHVLTKWLLDTVRQYRTQGYDPNSIYYAVNKYGYSYQDVKDALDQVQAQPKKFLHFFDVTKLNLNVLSPRMQFVVKYLFPSLAIFVLVMGYLFISTSTPETSVVNASQQRNATCQYVCCTDQECDDQNSTTVDTCVYKNNPLAACQHTVQGEVEGQRSLCGDSICQEDETSETCCLDCPCARGSCVDNVCQEEVTRCIVDSDCEDYQSETWDSCNAEGVCTFEAITVCRDNDGYCPGNCTATTDNDCQQLCTLDTDCNDANVSTHDVCMGTPRTCRYEAINECIDGDLFCPVGCTSFTDSDCARDACQNNSDCPSQDPCRPGKCIDTPKRCSYEPITQCLANDACCPVGCNAASDVDCPREEECLFDFECDDYLNATRDLCSEARLCEHVAITSCIPGDTYCPANCRYPQDTDCPAIDQCRSNLECNDNNTATRDECSGTPKRCVNTQITACINGDGYCPISCTSINDNDCTPTDECSTDGDCNDNRVSTRDSCTGVPKRCSYIEILECRAGDAYCPPGCTATTDADCGTSSSAGTGTGTQSSGTTSTSTYQQYLEEAYALIGQNGSVQHMLDSFPDLAKVKQEQNRRCGYYIGYVHSQLVDSTFIYCPRQGLTYAICQGRVSQFSTLFCRGSLS